MSAAASDYCWDRNLLSLWKNSIYTRAEPESSVVQCGQRVALTGIDIAQAGQSFATGGAPGEGRFILFTALTTRKMQKATMIKLMTRVIKLP
jgi:hypothetical protein